jgi:AcrR family transcriptional regulator
MNNEQYAQPLDWGFCCLDNKEGKMLSSVRTSEDPRVTRTRNLIITAFNDLLHEKGFERTTVQDIAARATVNRTTFYAHFEDKYTLFAYATRMQFRAIIQQRLDPDAPYSREQLKQLLRALSEFIQQLQQSCVRSFQVFEPMVAGEAVSEIAAILKTWRVTPCHDHLNGSVVTSVTSWGLYGVVRDWLLSPHPEAMEPFTDRVVRLTAPLVESLLTTV